MPYSVPISPPAGARSSDYPANSILRVANGSNYDCYDETDLFSATPNAGVATALLASPVKLHPKYLGLHCATADASKLKMGAARSIDASQWRTHNPSSGVFVDAGLGAWVSAMKAQGAEVIYTIFRTPVWCSARPAETGDPFGGVGGLAEPTDCSPSGPFGLFVSWLTSNYDIDAIEVYNEPKYNNGGSSFFSGTPAKLAELTRTANLIAKAIRPSVKIIGNAVTGINFNSVGSGIDFLGQFLAASDNNAGTGKQWIDAISVHTYTSPWMDNFSQMFLMKGFLDTVKAANGIASMPVWCTEYGHVPVNQGSDNRGSMLTTTGPAEARLRQVARYTLANVAAGMERSVWYAYGQAFMGWNRDPVGDAEWNRWVQTINGATVSVINRVRGGFQLACVIDGRNYLI